LSITEAVDQDSDIIELIREEEDRARRDHLLAVAMSRDGSTSGERVTRVRAGSSRLTHQFIPSANSR